MDLLLEYGVLDVFFMFIYMKKNWSVILLMVLIIIEEKEYFIELFFKYIFIIGMCF